jgi:deoxyribodipyrimidine photo-lyase
MAFYDNALFIFRRDLRVHDNTALNEVLRLSRRVLPCFIFDPRQIEPHPYQSRPALQFMAQSLGDLRGQLEAEGGKLALYQGLPVEIICTVHARRPLQAVFINRDYTPFSRRRDEELADACRTRCLPNPNRR